MTFIVYDLLSGKILKSIKVPVGDLGANIPVGFSIIPASLTGNDTTTYVDITQTPVVQVNKAALELLTPLPILADGVEEAVISNIPEGVFVTWPDGVREEVTDGLVEFRVTQTGFYKLKFDGLAYLNAEVTVEATS